MKPRTWLIATLLVILAVVGCAVAANVYLDIYGIFRDPRGRNLLVFGDERIAKYLLSERYIPANFNAVLIGSSVSENWKLAKIRPLRVYNDSLNGGNSVEEKCMVDQVLSRPGIQAAILIVHPYLTNSHEFETVPLTPRERRAALGSLSLWDAYKSKVKIRLGLEKQLFDEHGSEDFATVRRDMNPRLKRMMAVSGDFYVDPVALEAYRQAVAAFRSRSVPLIFIVPPPEENLLVQKRTAFQNYFNVIRPSMADGDLLIDFTSDEFTGFRADPRNFLDGVHLLPDGAAQVVSVINARLEHWISEGRLRPRG